MNELHQVNLFAGRFQPFHSGHLKCCEDAYKKNGLKTVIMYIHNEKFDARKPFDDKLIEEELDIIKKNVDYIEDAIWLRFPQPVRMCRVLREMGYQPVLWLAGEDRIDAYQKQLDGKGRDMIENELGMKVPELFQTERYGSATAVREAIKNDDKEEFKKLMPKGTDKLYDKFKEAMSSIKEGMKSITKYIQEKLQ